MRDRTRDRYRINDRIWARQVRLIDQNGKQVGIVPIEKARQTAREQGLDLVEINATTNPPICKILDFGKFKYELKKQAKESRKHQHQVKEKIMTMRPNIDKHDVGIKTSHIREFLQHGDKVTIEIRFRGREMEHQERGRELVSYMLNDLNDVAKVEREIKIEGRTLSLIIVPKREGGKSAKVKQVSPKEVPPNPPGQGALPQGGQGTPPAGQDPQAEKTTQKT